MPTTTEVDYNNPTSEEEKPEGARQPMNRFNPSGPVQSLLVVQDGEFFRITTIDNRCIAASRELGIVSDIRRQVAEKKGLETSAIFSDEDALEVVHEYKRRWQEEPAQLEKAKVLAKRCAKAEDAGRKVTSFMARFISLRAALASVTLWRTPRSTGSSPFSAWMHGADLFG